MKSGYDTAARAAGEQLLETLVAAMFSTGAVLAHAPSILDPLRQVMKDQDRRVRRAAVQALGKL